MGLFSKKPAEKEIKGGLGPIGIPLPPRTASAQTLADNSDQRKRFMDDFDNPFDISKHSNDAHDGGSAALVPTTLAPASDVDIGLPEFSTKSRHDMDLDGMEKELSIEPAAKEKNLKKDADDQEHELDAMIAAAKKMQDQKNSETEIHLPESQKFPHPKMGGDDPFNPDEIPDEIDDIPDFIPELDIESGPLSDNLSEVEEPKESRSAFIGLNSIMNIKSKIDEMKSSVDSIVDTSQTLADGLKKEENVLAKSRSVFEDVERKILFINKVLFSEG
jgi:hypothetical protein